MNQAYTSQNLKPYQHALLRGALPRMFMGATASAFVGGFYDWFQKIL
jgi:hypothetical protein